MNYYMFSGGCYEEYSITGLFKSKQDLSEEWLGEYLKNKLIESFPQATDLFKDLEPDLEELACSVGDKFYQFMTKDEKPRHYQTNYWERLDEWSKRKDSYNEACGFHAKVVEYALQDGILEPLKYKEIWGA